MAINLENVEPMPSQIKQQLEKTNVVDAHP